MKGTLSIAEVVNLTGLKEENIATWVANQWVETLVPAQLDQEDIARLRLIHELIADLGVNNEAVPVILHLLDQLYYYREKFGNPVFVPD